MTYRDLDELYARFLTGALDEEGCAELLRVLREKPEALAELAALQDTEIMLREMARSEHDHAESIDRIMVSIADPSRKERMTNSVLEAIKIEMSKLESMKSEGKKSVRRPHTFAKTSPRRRVISRTSSRWVFKLAAACVFIAAGTFAYKMYLAQKPASVDHAALVIGQVTDISDGTAVIVRGTGAKQTRIAVVTGRTFEYGDRIDASGDAHVTLHLDSGASINLSEGAEITFPNEGQGQRMNLTRGRLAANVSPQPKDDPLVFVTSHAEARVVGTILSIDAETAGTRLEVQEGKVQLTRLSDQKKVDVAAGHFAMAAKGQDLKACPVAPVAVVPDHPAKGLIRFYLASTRGPRMLPGVNALADGTIINLSALPTRDVTIVASLPPGVPTNRIEYITFDFNGKKNIQTKKQPPYAITDWYPDGSYKCLPIGVGTHCITATAYTVERGQTVIADQATINFKIIDNNDK